MHKNILIVLILAAVTLPEVCIAQQAVDLSNSQELTSWLQHGGKALEESKDHCAGKNS